MSAARRSSGVEWLGDVPGHWAVAPLFARYDVRLGKMLNPEAATGEHQAPYLGNADVQWGQIHVEELSTMSFPPAEQARFRLKHGDLLVCEGGDVGRTAAWLSQLPECYYQKALHRLRPRLKDDDPKFFVYVMRAATDRGAFLAEGNKSTIAHLTGEKLRSHRFPFPPLREQRAITTFLDRKTAAIDALIAKKERLIELLQEKRQALITQAVTKGLAPNVPTKEWGIQWFTSIPEAWALLPLRRLLSRVEQGWSPACHGHPAPEGAWGVLKAGCTAGGAYRWTENKELPLHEVPRPELEVRPGDLVMSRASGSRHIIGTCAIAVATASRLMLSDKHFRLRVDSRRLFPEFLWLALGSRPVRAQIEIAISGAEGLANNLPQSELRKVVLALPPLEDQSKLVDFVRARTKPIDTLIGVQQRSVERLREYRQALVTAAVTGQIDVSSPSIHHDGPAPPAEATA